jgi:sigma-B regulation protein RsbU (phosphoserine phosphatase)
MSDHLASFKQRMPGNQLDEAKETDRRLIELSALFEISQTINSSLNLQSILNNILLVPMGRMMIGKGLVLLKQKNAGFIVETVKGMPHSLHNKEINLINLPDHAFLINELDDSYSWKMFFSEQRIELIIPFNSRTDTLGLMGFSKKITNAPFTQEEIEFLTSLSNIASTSIENALIFDEIKSVNRELDHKIQELNTLFDIGKELNLTFEKERILKLLSYALMGQLTVNTFIIALREPDQFETVFVKGDKFNVKEGMSCGELCAKSSFITSPYMQKEGSEYDKLLLSLGIKIVVPMQIQNEKKGYIFLAEKITGQPYSNSDLEFLHTLGNIAIISLENARLFQETLEKQKMEEELNMARNIQQRLLPKSLPNFKNIELDGINVPSKQVGGDYFDVIEINEDLLGITIADVSGKGMPASLLMSNLQAALHALIRENFPPEVLVGRINNIIHNNTDLDKYITFFYGQLNLNTLELEFVNAGHNPPFLIRKSNKVELLTKGGIILGMMPNIVYLSDKVTLKRGDLLHCYTDGVTEAMNAEEEQYEEQRLMDLLQNLPEDCKPNQINQFLIEDINRFAGSTPQSDDLTILTIRIL